MKYSIATSIDVNLTTAEVEALIQEGVRRKLIKEDLTSGEYTIGISVDTAGLRPWLPTRLTIVTPKETT